MDIFEIATRKKFRFTSEIGELTTEQLWDLPLTRGTRRTGTDLDSVARAVHGDLKAVTTESFVQVNPDPRKGDLETKMEVVKHVIAAKQAMAEATRKAAERAEERRKLMDALASAEEKELGALSKDDILARLNALDAA
jgi:cbb3-type cytochrome oxidase cytochrome c subunit